MKRAANLIVLVVAVTFVGASAAQIVPAVFAAGTIALASAPVGSPENECAEGVRTLALAIDRAAQQAWTSPSTWAGIEGTERAHQAFVDSLSPEWNAEGPVEQACSRARDGSSAWAALLRLRCGEEQLFLRGLVDIAPLRRDVMEHLPPNLR